MEGTEARPRQSGALVYVEHLIERRDYAAAVRFVRAAVDGLERAQLMRAAVRRRALRADVGRVLARASEDGCVSGALTLAWTWVLDGMAALPTERMREHYRDIWVEAVVGGGVRAGMATAMREEALHDAAATRARNPEMVPLLLAEVGTERRAQMALRRELERRLRRMR